MDIETLMRPGVLQLRGLKNNTGEAQCITDHET